MINQDNLGGWVESAKQQLTGRSDRPLAEARLLAAHVLKTNRSFIVAHPETTLSTQQITALQEILRRYLIGEPLPYLLGHWEFFGLDFIVTSDVLIPRPETEILVEHALTWLKANPNQNRVMDIGTGSGCIAVSLSHHQPDIKVIAVDRSLSALRCAVLNAKNHHVNRQIQFVQSNLIDALQCSANMICANLPYIPTAKLKSLSVARHEPHLALDGGENGLDLIKTLLLDAKRILAPRGIMLLEIEEGQKESVLEIGETIFPAIPIQVIPDYHNKPRLLMIETR